MDKMKVKELMRPIDEFPKISSKATFLEAIDALEDVQRKVEVGKVPEVILLVINDKKDIVGKLSPMDVVIGLEPNSTQLEKLETFSHYGLVRSALNNIKKQFQLWQKPLEELWDKAHDIKIENFIKLPEPEHMVKTEDKMDTAFHLFVLLRQGSLFVREQNKIVGLIRFSDVYKNILKVIKTCDIPAPGNQK